MPRSAIIAAVMAAVLVPVFAQPDKLKPPTPVDTDPFADMVQKLHYQRVGIDYVPKGKTLREIRDEFEKMLGVKIVVDENLYRELGPDGDNILDKQAVSLTNLKGMTIGRALKLVAEDVYGVLMVRQLHLELTPRHVAAEQLDDEPEDSEQRDKLLRQMPLVCGVYKDKPMAEAVDELAKLYDRTVVVAAQAEKAAKTAVSARLLNVPFDTAMYTLAAAAGMEVARRGNVYVISTPDHVKTLKAGAWK